MEAVFRKYNLLLDKKDITEAVLNGDIADHEFTTTFKDSIWAEMLEYYPLYTVNCSQFICTSSGALPKCLKSGPSCPSTFFQS